jgi:hypothetical protein
MIPVVLLMSFAIGRLWVIPAAAVLWTMLVATAGDCGPSCWAGAALFGAANAAIGVAFHLAIVTAARAIRRGVRAARG